MNPPLPPRVFLRTVTASSAAIATRAPARVLVDERDAQAAVPGYVADGKRVHGTKYPGDHVSRQ